MKKMLIFLVVLLALIGYAYAGDAHYISFDSGNIQTVTMAERDIARFNISVMKYYEPYIENGMEKIEWTIVDEGQAFMLREVRAAMQKNQIFNVADITLFIEGAETPQYTTMTEGTVLNTDFEKDSVDDLEIRILSIDLASKNVTFEFLLKDKENANYKPRYFISRNQTKITETEGVLNNGKIGEEDNTDNNILAYLGAKVDSIVKKIYDNWQISIVVVIVLLILLINKRPIEKFFRRVL